MAGGFELLEAEAEPWISTARALIREYADWIEVDLCFQEIDAELAGLPGKYARASGGALLLARQGAQVAGCIALRALEPRICEMKRLWVRMPFRGAGLGQLLVRSVLARAHAIGYDAIRLDTLPHMDQAQKLYLQLGFQPIPAYYDNPLPGAIYLEKKLRT